MSKQDYKVDFMGLISVTHANPNGDPLCGGRPRTDSDGFGIITDVCLKRKLRNRLAEMGEPIFVSPPEQSKDSLEHRASAIRTASKEDFADAACRRWFDVRAFGQVFATSGRRGCVNIRGPVSIQHAFSADPIVIEELPITRCINGKTASGRGSDTLGFRPYVRYGLYVLKGSICAGQAAKTGFSEQDCMRLRNALMSIFLSDASSARPAGSMVLERLYWWNHHSFIGDVPSSALFDTVQIRRKDGVETPRCFSDYIIEEHHIEGITPRIFAYAIPEETPECKF